MFLTFIAFWAGAIIPLWRRRLKPTKMDLLLVRVGYLPLIIITTLLTHEVWSVRGF